LPDPADRILVIETATAACSVALIEQGRVIAEQHDLVGRGHAERLVPMIAALPDGGRAAHILVDVGPGSFTGIRVGIAAARGLGLGWGATVAGMSSLALVAAAAGAGPLAVVLEGGHGELFMQVFDTSPLAPAGPLLSLPPAAVRERATGLRLIGDGVRWLESGDPRAGPRGPLPRAGDAIFLPPALTQLPPRPLYGRAPDAKLPA
jgi:tRNA threonylcarbamoyl adenosine modification protein YeaZ